jgi:hypothetical protein
LKATVADIIMKYVHDPDTRERAVNELTRRVDGESAGKYIIPVQESWHEENA